MGGSSIGERVVSYLWKASFFSVAVVLAGGCSGKSDGGRGAKAGTESKARPQTARKGPVARPSTGSRPVKKPPPPARKYAIRLSRPMKSGQRYRVVYSARQTSRVTVKYADGNVRRGGRYWKLRYEAVVTVDRTDPKGRVKKETHRITRFRASWRGRLEHDVLPKDTLLDVDVYRKHIRIRPRKAKLENAFNKVLQPVTMVHADGPSPDEIWGTPKPQPVGSTWAADGEKAVKALKLGVKTKDFKGHSKLLNMGESEGVPYLEIETRASAANLSRKLMKGFKHKASEVTYWLTSRLPVTPAALWAEYEFTLKTRVTALGTRKHAPPSSIEDLIGRSVRGVLKGRKLPGRTVPFASPPPDQQVTLALSEELLYDLKIRPEAGKKD